MKSTKERYLMKIEVLTKLVNDLEKKEKRFFGIFMNDNQKWLLESFRRDLKRLWEKIDLVERKKEEQPAK